MSEPKPKFYLTTPIYYVNARPHIGHAYTTIAADVIARRHRLLGDDTFFLTGTDEHGQKIQRSAEAAGIPPQQFADEVSASFQNLWKRMGITNDDYIRTTEPRHKAGVQKLFRTLQQNGFIELRSYTGQYCISDETFVDVLVGAPCPECGRITETVTEKNYFFKLSAFQRQLIDLIESEDPDNRLLVQPESRKNEVLSFLRGNVSAQSATKSPGAPPLPELHPGKGGNVGPPPAAGAGAPFMAQSHRDMSGIVATEPAGISHSTKGTPYVPGALKDLSISRTSFKWGIPVPSDEKHVIYVWLDALANYMTAIGYGADERTDLTEEQKKEEQAKFEKYWPADLHLVGKEIIRFHCVYWPAFLLALNPELAGKQPEALPFEKHLAWAKKMLPKQITAHGWLLFENDKMSKSKGNIVRTETILDAFGTLCPPLAAVPSEAKEGGSTGLQPGESSHQIKGALAPGLPTDAWKHEQDLFAADVLRYFLLREIPFGNDGSFSFDALVQRYNSDLANGYGNLVSRTLSMINKYFEGHIPMVGDEYFRSEFLVRDTRQLSTSGATTEIQIDTQSIVRLGPNTEALVDLKFEEYEFSRSFEWGIWNEIRATDGYITLNAPWKLDIQNNDSDEHKLRELLYTAAESIRFITALLYPILPYATSKVWTQLGLGDIEKAARNGELKDLQWGGLKPGTKLGPLGPIFPRAPKELIQLMNEIESANAPKFNGSKSVVALPQVNSDLDASTRHRSEFAEMPIASASATAALNKAAETVHPISAHHAAEPAKPETPQIAIDDFIKVDLRVAQIVVAERIPKADKLLRLEVDLGYERRQILSGIAQWYTPEELIGRRIVVIANLAPRKMRGLESHGMLLAASKGEDDKPVLATFGEDIALGSRLK